MLKQTGGGQVGVLAVISHLVWGAVLLSTAGRGLLVIFPNVHHLPLGALSDEVPPHSGYIFKPMTCRREILIKKPSLIRIQDVVKSKSKLETRSKSLHTKSEAPSAFCVDGPIAGSKVTHAGRRPGAGKEKVEKDTDSGKLFCGEFKDQQICNN